MKSFNKSIGMLLILGASILTACSNAKVGKVSFTDGEEHADAVLPFHGVDSSYAWAMMQIEKVEIEVSFENNAYVYVTTDYGISDTSNDRYFLRIWTFNGTYEEVESGFKMASPTSGTRYNDYGDTFADYQNIFGPEGTVDLDATALAKVKPAIATITDGAISFTLVE